MVFGTRRHSQYGRYYPLQIKTQNTILEVEPVYEQWCLNANVGQTLYEKCQRSVFFGISKKNTKLSQPSTSTQSLSESFSLTPLDSRPHSSPHSLFELTS